MGAENKRAIECFNEYKYFMELCGQGALKFFLRVVVAQNPAKTLNVAFPFDFFKV